MQLSALMFSPDAKSAWPTCRFKRAASGNNLKFEMYFWRRPRFTYSALGAVRSRECEVDQSPGWRVLQCPTTFVQWRRKTIQNL